MSGAGKSTLAQGLANRLRRLGKLVDILDGQEVEQIIDLTLHVLKTFGFHDYQVSLSTRPEKFVGEIPTWDRAEKALAELTRSTKN